MRPWFKSTGLAALAALTLAACGPLTPVERARDQGLEDENGLSPNGLNQNGLSQNGLSQNGLSQNGLSQNGLSQNGLGTAFSNWFNQNTSLSNIVMGYIVRCALPSGQSRTWTNPSTGATYTWQGALGLTPSWSGGSPASETEQQLITACLAGHVNKYGLHVTVSFQGRGANGSAIPLAWNELSYYPVREACFFGNLFTGEGIFVGEDHVPWDSKYSSARACALDYRYGPTPDCTPLVVLGDCSALCTLDAGGNYYTSCTYNGKSYKPLTTRLRSSDIYRCGDGVCQFTESCGSGYSYYNCQSDCGWCW